MALYYLPLLIRSDRYFVARLESDKNNTNWHETDFNFVVNAEDRVLTPLLTIEDPGKIVLNHVISPMRVSCAIVSPSSACLMCLCVSEVDG